MSLKILVAEDEEITLKHLLYALEKEGYTASGVHDGLEAWDMIKEGHFDVVITDIKMPGMDGITLLEKIEDRWPETEVIIITGFGSIDSAVEAMKRGAYDYITKPFNLDEILIKIKKILEKKSLENQNIAFRISLGLDKDIPPFIARSKNMRHVVDIIESISRSDCNVIITGESGVGKGLVAKLIHYTGKQSNGPFLALNCAIFTEQLLASELFGHERGAFTGASSAKKGMIEVAHKGTLFLDEIAEMSPSLQAKLLKVIEDREFFRVGGTRHIKVDVRFIAASNQNLKELIDTKKFRKDLFFRLNVMDIYIPPLRERKEDIVPLSKYFLQKHTSTSNKEIKGFTREAMDILKSYSYPGNVRELENIIERAVILERNSYITPDSLPVSMQLFRIETVTPDRIKSVDELTRDYALKILEFVDGNKTKAAEMLGISRTSLWRILKEGPDNS
ncbi:transcriptional regulatory protein ZraR [bacterium BMS3Bbin05]|nr:transcriptional regulatory protein ZraR [bacterium BMS3Bbin05]HDO22081.1 sigma-54-dependent Fis family transcriptional regulator [Nitrospirota bacterium]